MYEEIAYSFIIDRIVIAYDDVSTEFRCFMETGGTGTAERPT